jgi:hypothetical protein
MFLILLALIFVTSNFIRRKAMNNGLPALRWSIASMLSFGVGLFVGCIVLSFLIMKKNPAFYELAAQNDKAGLNDMLNTVFSQNQFVFTAIILCGGFGGSLFVNYLLDKKIKQLN